MGAIAASQAIAAAASPSSHAPPSPPVSEAAARCAAHGGADLRGPLLLQRGAAVQPEQVRQRDVRPDLDRLTGPLRQQARRDQAAHRLLQRVVVPLLPGPGVLGAGRGGQRIQHRRHDRGALRSQVPVQHASTLERRLQPHAPVPEIPRPGPHPAGHRGPARTSPRTARPGPAGPAPPAPRRSAAHRTPPGTSPAACPSTGRSPGRRTPTARRRPAPPPPADAYPPAWPTRCARRRRPG